MPARRRTAAVGSTIAVRLRGFRRVTLAPGAQQTVSFTLDKSDYGFHDNREKLVVEPGAIDVYAGDSSSAGLTQSFTLGG